jgi:hypothetical protein
MVLQMRSQFMFNICTAPTGVVCILIWSLLAAQLPRMQPSTLMAMHWLNILLKEWASTCIESSACPPLAAGMLWTWTLHLM